MAATAFLARAEHVERLQPQVELYVAGFQHRANLDGEGLATDISLVNAGTRALARQLTYALLLFAARALGAVRPQPGLDPGIGCDFIVILRLRKN